MGIFNVENLSELLDNVDYNDAVHNVSVIDFDLSLYNKNFTYIAQRETSVDLNVKKGSPQWLFWFRNKSNRFETVTTGKDPGAIIPLNITQERVLHTIDLMSKVDKFIMNILVIHYDWESDDMINFMVMAEAGFLTTIADDRHYSKLWPKYYGSHAFNLRKKGHDKVLFTLLHKTTGKEFSVTYRR